MLVSNSPILIFTGGHHTSGLAVAKILFSSTMNIVWFGHRHSAWGDTTDSAEYQEVTAAGITFVDLHAGKFFNTFHPLKLIRIPWGFLQAFYHLLVLKIHYGSQIAGIVSFGGYLAVPVVICGWLLNIPAVTHEQTLVSGWANRLLALFCRKIGISWLDSQKYYPRSKCVYVGLTVRPEIINHQRLSTNRRPTLYVTGGKQGSHLINTVIFSSLENLLTKYIVIHQTGRNSIYQDFSKALSLRHKHYYPFDYTDAQTTAENLKRSDLVISRSGAHILAELLYLKKKSILIPIPWVSHQEQAINAQYLADMHQAIVIPQSQFNSQTLFTSLPLAFALKPQHRIFNFSGIDNFAQLVRSELLTNP